jgi:uncharacterized protein YjbJ (UPF0337 family)
MSLLRSKVPNKKKLEGAVRETVGKATGNKKMEMTGKAQGALGNIQIKTKNASDVVQGTLKQKIRKLKKK